MAAPAEAAPVKVYGHPMSTTSMVMWCGFELGHPVEIVTVNLHLNEHKSPEYLKRQPFGKIPAMSDGDFQLYESRAICRYLDEKYDGGLVPKDIKAKALFEQWMSLEYGTYYPPILVLMTNFFAKWVGKPRDEEAVAKASADLKRDGAVLNDQLGKHHYITGDSFALVDLILCCWLPPMRDDEAVKAWFAEYPNISAWYDRCTARPGYQKLSAIIAECMAEHGMTDFSGDNCNKKQKLNDGQPASAPQPQAS